jgi:DNA-binding NtrC family response regulator
MTDDVRRSSAMELLGRCAYDCIRKPPFYNELKIRAQRAFEHGRRRRELAKMRLEQETAARCDGLVGSSGKAQLVYDLIRRVSDLNAFVLITGQSGTGKELVARAIHNLGRRAKSPFIAVSCGAIPETLIVRSYSGTKRVPSLDRPAHGWAISSKRARGPCFWMRLAN